MRMKFKRSVAVGLLILIAVFFGLSVVFRSSLQANFQHQVEDFGLLGLGILSLLLEAVPQYIAPQLLALTAAGLGYGAGETFVALYLGSIIGSSAAYELGRISKGGLLAALLSEKSKRRAEDMIARKGKWALLLSAISPLPYIPLLLGMLGFGRRTFWLLGILPRSLYFLGFILVGSLIF